MIHFEVRWLNYGGFCSAVPPLTSSPSTSFVFSFFVLEKKAFVPELRQGLGHV